MKTVLATLSLLALFPGAAVAQRGRAEVAEGNRRYAEGDYTGARESYLDGLREAPESPLIRFDEGNALYQSQSFEEALDSYRVAVAAADTTLQARAWYNMGNALFRGQQLEESIEAYKQALRLDPLDEDARHNLELALNMQQEQQQQQQGEGEDQNQQQDQQDGENQQNQQGGEGEDQQQQQQQQDQEQQQGEQPQQGQEQQSGEDENQQQQGQPQEGQMTREEAERLLQAIEEDAGAIRRQMRRTRGRVAVTRDW